MPRGRYDLFVNRSKGRSHIFDCHSLASSLSFRAVSRRWFALSGCARYLLRAAFDTCLQRFAPSTRSLVIQKHERNRLLNMERESTTTAAHNSFLSAELHRFFAVASRLDEPELGTPDRPDSNRRQFLQTRRFILEAYRNILWSRLSNYPGQQHQDRRMSR
jgi:hypothetical protein